MATLSVINTTHTNVQIRLDGLQYPVGDYDKLVYVFKQNGTTILSYTYDWSTSIFNSVTFQFSNDGYLGNNWFSPMTTYSVSVVCYWSGVGYTVGPVSFTTDAITPPSGSITPSVYVDIHDQGSYYTCVAHSLTVAMEIFKAKVGVYEKYSIAYVFGADGGSWGDYGMMNEEAVGLCSSYGAPRWELTSERYPDNFVKSTSILRFQMARNNSLVSGNAARQSFTGSGNIDFYDCEGVRSAIQNYGYFMLNLKIPYNFYNVPSSGIVPQPSGGYTGVNHSIALIGLTTISNKKYWIAQNSWGTNWGQSGRCYIPYDWGCGVQAPTGSGNTDNTTGWTTDCYSVRNSSVSALNPMRPTSLSAQQSGQTTNVDVNWSIGTSGASILLYAYLIGTSDIYPKPSYGSAFSGVSGAISFDNNDVTYIIRAYAIKDYFLSVDYREITIILSSSAVTRWYWDIKAGVGVVVTGQPVSSLLYEVWNDFIDWLISVVGIKYTTEPTISTAVQNSQNMVQTGATRTFSVMLAYAKVTSSDKTLTAQKFNIARYIAGQITGSAVCSVRYRGDAVLATYFTGISAGINASLPQ